MTSYYSLAGTCWHTRTRIHLLEAHRASQRNAIIAMRTFLICLLCAKVHPREDNIRTKLIRRRFKQNTRQQQQKMECNDTFESRTRNIQYKRTWYLFDLCVRNMQFPATTKRREWRATQVKENTRAIKMIYSRYAKTIRMQNTSRVFLMLLCEGISDPVLCIVHKFIQTASTRQWC